LQSATTIPICTGEDIYLAENFKPLLDSHAVSVIHPDILTCGGASELKRVADMADDNGIAVAIHMAESPIACMAAVHVAAAMHNVLALELHSVDVPWWKDIVIGLEEPFSQNGYIKVPERPGLGIEALNDQIIQEHLNTKIPGLWESTDEWNQEFSNDRIWS
jgi:L-alanine-DL-glutamate epimerase-like enolase superfamily enzyme